MAETRDIYIFEQDGYFWLTDQCDLNRVRFLTADERAKWIGGYEAATGKAPHVIAGKPDVVANLMKL